MKKLKKWLPIALAMLTAAASLLSGCSSGSPAREAQKTTAPASGSVKFPLQEQTSLTIWEPVPNASLISQYSDMSDLPKYKELSKRTNIKIKVVCPPAGQEKDQFNLLVASGNLPDIFDRHCVSDNYSGGTQKAFKDGIIIKLNDLQKANAPDLEKIYATYKDIDALCRNSDGDYLSVPFLRGNPAGSNYMGPMVRKDWLDELGLSVPETMDDWENMLMQFKTKKGATAPLLLNLSGGIWSFGDNFLIGTYGITNSYFIEDGKVKYGPTDPRYKDFLIEMNKWYKEGLIDPEAATENSQTYDAKASSNKTGAFSTLVGGGMGKYLQQMAKVDPSYKLVGVPYPVKEKGASNKYFQFQSVVSNEEACISSKCKQPDIAMALLNYGFSKEGYLLYNYGIEGTSYTIQDGKPMFSDTVRHDAQGLSMQAACLKYQWSITDGCTVQDTRVSAQYMPFKEQTEALQTWTKDAEELSPSTNWQPMGKLTSDETSSITSSETQIYTYAGEMLLKFIEGQQPINDVTFNDYLKQVNSLGLENNIKVRQTAEDRFKASNPEYYKLAAFSSPFDLYKDIVK